MLRPGAVSQKNFSPKKHKKIYDFGGKPQHPDVGPDVGVLLVG
jgi:hypothetical protein